MCVRKREREKESVCEKESFQMHVWIIFIITDGSNATEYLYMFLNYGEML